MQPFALSDLAQEETYDVAGVNTKQMMTIAQLGPVTALKAVKMCGV